MITFIQKEEAATLKERLLNDPDFRDGFFAMEPFRELVSLILRARSLEDTEAHRSYASQKAYEIVFYDLSRPDGIIRCDTRFWKDVQRVVTAKYDGWMTREEGSRIIDDVINRRDITRLQALVKGICESRLYEILSTWDKALLDEMVNMTLGMYLDKDCALLKRIESPGAIKGNIKTTVHTLFLKWQQAKITEAFENPNGKDCGYAHLTMTVKEGKLKEYFGTQWYELAIRIPFRSSVEAYYDPYGTNPGYQESTEKNNAIEDGLKKLFRDLKALKGIRGDFPASCPEVSYNRTPEPWMEIEEHLSEGLQTLLLSYREPEAEPSGDKLEEDEPKEPAETAAVPMMENDRDVIVDRFMAACSKILRDPVKMEVFIRKALYEQPAKEIGLDLFQRGLLPETVLDGLSPDSAEGLDRLEKKVNKLTQTAKNAFERAIRTVKDFDLEDLLAFFNYVIKQNTTL